MDLVPDATQPDHTQVHDALATLDGPRHPRTLAPLRQDDRAGGLRDAGAQGYMLVLGGLIAHPWRTLFDRGIGLLGSLGRATKAAPAPKSRGRLSHPSHPVGLRLHHLAHLFRPS